MKLKLSAIFLGISLAYATVPATATESISITQTGVSTTSNDAYVEQTGNTDSSILITQDGANRVGASATSTPGVQQQNNVNASIVIHQVDTASANVKQVGVDNSSVVVNQDGRQLFGNIEQTDSSNSLITLTQGGAHQAANLQQDFVTDGKQKVTQVGDTNTGKVVQANSTRVSAELLQDFGFGDALLVQTRVTDSTLFASQLGGANRIFATQNQGAHLTGSITQTGMNHLANVTQSGSYSTATVKQTGSWNDATILQAGHSNLASITQAGTGVDFGSRNVASIDQLGSNLSTTLSQTGASQLVSIKQR